MYLPHKKQKKGLVQCRVMLISMHRLTNNFKESIGQPNLTKPNRVDPDP